MILRPINDNVLIDPEPDPDYTETKGYTHVVVPEAFRHGPVDLPKWGRILAFGNACKSTAGLKVGDRVLYGKFSWAKLVVDETKHYAVVRDYDLLAVDDQSNTHPPREGDTR